MSKIYLVLFLVFSISLGSCKKCKEKDCQNGASCSLLNNEAVCACDEFYIGDRCDTETRETYVGVYNGTPVITIGGVDFNGNNTEYVLEKNGGEISKFKISSTDTNNTTQYFCKLTSDTDFTIENVDVSNGSTTISGSGTISTTNFRMSGSITQTGNGGTVSGTFVIQGYK